MQLNKKQAAIPEGKGKKKEQEQERGQNWNREQVKPQSMSGVAKTGRSASKKHSKLDKVCP